MKCRIMLLMSFLLTSVYGQNVLLNGGFEDEGSGASEAAGWSVWGNHRRWDLRSYCGMWSATVPGSWAGANEGRYWQDVNGVVAGASYVLRGEVWSGDAFSSTESYLKLSFYDAATQVVHAVTNVFSNPGPMWTLVELTNAVAPANAVSVRAEFGASGVGADSELWMDDVQLFTGTTEIFSDDFEDGDLDGWTQDAEYGGWTNSTNRPITGFRSLQFLTNETNEAFIYTEPGYDVADGETVWQHMVRYDGYTLSQTPNNRFWTWLMADTANLRTSGAERASGYAVGVQVQNDVLTVNLYRFDAGEPVLLIASDDTYEKGGTNKAVQVTRTAGGVWSLSTGDNSFDALQARGSGTDVTYTDAYYYGVYYKFTGASMNDLWVDDISIMQHASQLGEAPYVGITNPTGSYYAVDKTVESKTISGIASNGIGTLSWENLATGDSGSPAVEAYWSVQNVALNAGSNVIRVSISNESGIAAIQGDDDAAQVQGNWVNGQNSGFGFGDWAIWSDGADAGAELMGSIEGGSNIDIDTAGKAYSVYGYRTNNHWGNAQRMFNRALASGTVFECSFAVNYLAGGRGVDILNKECQSIFNLNMADVEGVAQFSFTVGGTSEALQWPNDGNGYNYDLRVEQIASNRTVFSVQRSDGKVRGYSVVLSSAPAGIKFYGGNMGDGFEKEQRLYANAFRLYGPEAQDQVIIYRQRGDLPEITITNPVDDATFEWNQACVDVSGSGSNLTGSIDWVNYSSGASGTTVAADSWLITDLPLEPGRNQIQVTGVNASNETAKSSVFLVRRYAPAVVSVVEPSADVTVGNLVSSYAVSGSGTNLNSLNWSNTLTGADGVMAAGDAWALTNVALGVGDNYVVVSVTNNRGYAVDGWDLASEQAYDAGWTNGADGGEGFAAWELRATDGVNYGMGTNAYGQRAWGLSAAGGAVAEAVRDFGRVLESGDEVRLNLTLPAAYSSSGVMLLNSGGEALLAFYAEGNTWYVRHNSGGVDDATDVPWSTNGVAISLVLGDDRTYCALITPQFGQATVFKGMLMNPAAGDRVVAGLKCWQYYDGVVAGEPLYMDDVSYRHCLSRDFVRITRESGEVPSIAITTPEEELVYVENAITEQIVIGTCNKAVVPGNLLWENSLTATNGQFAACTNWTHTFALGVGRNVITVTATNGLGEARSAQLTVVRDTAGIYTNYPDVEMIWPEMGATVNYEQASITVTGTCSAQAVGTLQFHNVTQTGSTSVAVAADWTVEQALEVGLNSFYVEATNAEPVEWVTDSPDMPAYDKGWTNGLQSGEGLSAWRIESTGMASNQVGVASGLPTAWKLYAESGSVIKVSRTFSSWLREGDRFSTWLVQDTPDAGGKAGIALQNAAGLNLLELYREAGQATYRVADRDGVTETAVDAV